MAKTSRKSILNYNFLLFFILFFFICTFTLANLSLSSFAQTNIDTTKTNDTETNEIEETEKIQELTLMDEEELKDSSITTKIYKSSDQNDDLIQNNADINSSLDDSILMKEELLGKVKVKNASSKPILSNQNTLSNTNHLLPWVILSFLSVILYFLIRLLKENKI